jgi:preprotein translocase subunit YajC
MSSMTDITLLQILPLAIVLSILYVAYVRPQQKKAGRHKQMLRELRPGDQVVTVGGFHARIAELVDERTLILELSPTIHLKADKQGIEEVLVKAPPHIHAH